MGVRIGRQYALSWMKKAEDSEKNYRHSRSQTLAFYEEAIKRDPEFAEPWYKKGILISNHRYLHSDSAREEFIKSAPPGYSGRLNRYDLAETCFEKALEIEPNSIDALFEKGKFHNSFSGTGVKEDALICLNKVLELDSKHVDALEEKIDVLENMQKFEESLVCIEQIIKINRKKSSGLSLAWSIVHKANILYELGKFNDSLKLLDKEITHGNFLKKEAYTLNRKGLILAKLERYYDALDCFDESKESSNGYRHPFSEIYAEVNFCRALCLQETFGDKKEIFQYYTSAINLSQSQLAEYAGTTYAWKVLKNGLTKFHEYCDRESPKWLKN